MPMLSRCFVVLLFVPESVQALLQGPRWEVSRSPMLDPNGDGSATGPGSSWLPKPRISQKAVSEVRISQKTISQVAYPRRGVVNLDLPPRQRWKELIAQYREELIPFDNERAEIFDRHTEIDQAAWTEAIQAQFTSETPESLEELRGVEEAMNNPSSNMNNYLLSTALYELGSPLGCSQLIMAAKDGTVLHGRNLDYKLEAPISEVVYLRNGRPSFILPQFVGAIGLVTVVKPGHWAFAQDTRIVPDDTPQNTLKRVKAGAKIYPILLRSYANQDLEYDDVVAKLREVVLVRSSYFVLSGAAPYQGTVITRWWDPSFRYTQDLTSTGKWYAFQSNDDGFAPPKDNRRDAALHAMAVLNQSAVNPETMISIMHTPPIFMNSNVYLFVMSAKSGKYCTVLGPTTKNDDTSVDCHMDGWSETMPVDASAWTRWTK